MYITYRNNKRGNTMKKIYVATKLRAEDCDGSYVSVIAVGSFEDCKKAVRSAWNKVAKHEDIGEFDEKANSEWSCYIEDSVKYTLTFNIHCVEVNKNLG